MCGGGNGSGDATGGGGGADVGGQSGEGRLLVGAGAGERDVGGGAGGEEIVVREVQEVVGPENVLRREHSMRVHANALSLCSSVPLLCD